MLTGLRLPPANQFPIFPRTRGALEGGLRKGGGAWFSLKEEPGFLIPWILTINICNNNLGLLDKYQNIFYTNIYLYIDISFPPVIFFNFISLMYKISLQISQETRLRLLLEIGTSSFLFFFR